MSITDITNKIIEDASEKASKITEHGEKKVKSIELDMENIVSKMKEDHLKELDKVILENERNVRSAALREAKLFTERSRREVLESAYKKALEKLNSLSERRYEGVLKNILMSVDKNAKGTVYCPKDRVKETKNVLHDLGIKCDVVSKDGVAGGLIFEGDDFEYDLTFEHMFNTQKDKIEAEVAEILFR